MARTGTLGLSFQLPEDCELSNVQGQIPPEALPERQLSLSLDPLRCFIEEVSEDCHELVESVRTATEHSTREQDVGRI